MRYYDERSDEHAHNCDNSVSSVSLNDEDELELSSVSITYPLTKPLPKSGSTSQSGNSLIKDHDFKKRQQTYIEKEPFQQRYSSNLVMPSLQFKSHASYSSFKTCSPPPTCHVSSTKDSKLYENNLQSTQSRSQISNLSTSKRTCYPSPRQSCLSPERNTKCQRFLLSSGIQAWQQYNLPDEKKQPLKPISPLSVVNSYDSNDEAFATNTPPKSKRYHYSDGELFELEEDILSNFDSINKQIPSRCNDDDHVSLSSNSTTKRTDRQFEELEDEILSQSKDSSKTFSIFTEEELKALEDYFLNPSLASAPFLNDELRQI